MIDLDGKLSEQEKRDYIRHAADNLFVEAGAGAGKTTLLARRIINQIKNGEDPTHFLIITFTDTAAQELHDKIMKHLSREIPKLDGATQALLIRTRDSIDTIDICTMQDFAEKILHVYGGKGIRRKLTEYEARTRRDRFFREWASQHESEMAAVKDAMQALHCNTLLEAFRAIADIHSEIITDAVPEDIMHPEDRLMALILKIRTDYLRYIATDSNGVSKGQLLREAWQLMSMNPSVTADLRKHYTKIYYDEFQDTDSLQSRIIASIVLDASGRLRDNVLFLIGDEKQSIFRPYGAQVEIYQNVMKQMAAADNANVLTLDGNFRSNPKIVTFVNKTFQKRIHGYKSMLPCQEGASQFPLTGVYHYESTRKSMRDAENAAQLIGMILRAYSFLRYSDFLIIVKNPSHIGSFIDALRHDHIPADGDMSHETVHVLDVHHVKGLSVNIVLVADRIDPEETRYETLRIGNRCYPSFVVGRQLSGEMLYPSYHRHPELMALARSEEHAEWVRLEYVAATRAKHALIFLPAMHKGAWFSDPAYQISSLPRL